MVVVPSVDLRWSAVARQSAARLRLRRRRRRPTIPGCWREVRPAGGADNGPATAATGDPTTLSKQRLVKRLFCF